MAAKIQLPKALTALLAGLAVAAVVSLLHLLGLLMPLEYKTRDMRMRWTIPAEGGHPDIVMVYYSEESVSSIREKWKVDWRNRELIAKLIRGLSGKPSEKQPALGPGAAPPTVVLLDLFTLCDPSEFSDDLLTEIRDHKSLHLAVPFSSFTRKSEYAPEEFLKRFAIPVENDGSVTSPEYASVVLPVEEICAEKDTEGNPLGHLHAIADVRSHPDIDGVDRRYHLLCRFRGRYYPSFALAAILEREGTREVRIANRVLSVGSFSVPVDGEGAILVRYYKATETFRSQGVYDVMNGRIAYDNKGASQNYDPAKYEKKIVIVGATAAGLFDLRVTPVAEVMPGVDIHASAIANLLNRGALHPVGRGVSFFLILVMALGAAFVTRYTPAWAGGAGSVLLVGAYLGANVLAFKARWVVDLVPQLATIVLAYAATSAVNYLYEGRQKQKVKRTFQQYVSAKVVDKILKTPDAHDMAGERKTLSIFFMDFAGFTTLSETLDPPELVKLVTRYNNVAVEEIFKTEGTLDKFMGDCIMAFWGDPIVQSDHAARACRTAIAIQPRLRELAEALKWHGLPGISARIGLNTGLAVAGNMGSDMQFNYTVIGSDVNLASRLEGVNKEFGTEIIISDATYQGARDSVEVRTLAKIQVKGQTKGVLIYELLGEKGQVDAARLEVSRAFEQGLRLFWERKWPEARAVFAKCGDKTSKVYLELCDEHAKKPPPGDWDGTYIMTHK